MENVSEKEVEMFTEEQYDEMLNEQGDVMVCGMTFDASRILKELDPIAYSCGFNDMQEYETHYTCDCCGTEHETDEDAAIDCCPGEDEEED